MMVFAQNPTLGLVYCDQTIVLPDGNQKTSKKELINENLLQKLLEFWTAPNTSTLMFKKSVFENMGGFNEDMSSCQDHDLWMRIALYGISVDVVHEALSFFHIGDSERISNNLKERMRGVNTFLNIWKNVIIDHKGKLFFKNFSNQYKLKAAFPIFARAFREKKIIQCFDAVR
ncbi:MAG: hypothetical protein ACOC80_11975, partial [Petrotogales bacterium]